MNQRVLGKNVLLAVEKVTALNKTAGGIFLPDDPNAEDELKFTVVAIGKDVTADFVVGDVVLRPEVTVLRHTRTRQGAPEFDTRLDDGRDAIVVEESDIRLILEDSRAKDWDVENVFLEKLIAFCKGDRITVEFPEDDSVVQFTSAASSEVIQGTYDEVKDALNYASKTTGINVLNDCMDTSCGDIMACCSLTS